MAKKTLDLPPLEMRAAFKPSSINEEARTVELVWTTGEKVLRSDWDGQFLEELSLDPAHVRMDRLTSGRAPLLANHDSQSLDSVLGVVETANIGSARVRFAKDDPAADAVFNKVKQGIITNVSVGYRIHKFEKLAGPKGEIPTYRAVDWQPYEISMVPAGADSAAQVRSTTVETNPCEIFTRGAPQEEQHQMADPTTPAPVDAVRTVDTKAIAAEAVKTERERSTGIRAAVRAARLEESLAEKMIADETSLDAARAAVLEEMAKRSDALAPAPHASGAPTVVVGEEDSEKFIRAASAALLTRFGQGSMLRAMADKKHSEFESMPKDNGGTFRSMRIAELARMFLGRNGVRTDSMSDAKIVERAMTFQRSGGENTAGDFAVVLENVMYKTLLGNYELADDTWKRFCDTDATADFRPSNRYRTGSFGTLAIVPEGAEFTNVAIPDGLKQSIAVDTKGRMIALSRQALVNDDMGALLDTVGKFGRAAGLSIESDVYALLNANSGLGYLPDGSTPFFTGANISTGAALSVSALDADRVQIAMQKDISANEYLNLAKFGEMTLLVPVTLGGQARLLNSNIYDPSTSSKFQVNNIVKGMFKDVVDSPRLSGTRRYIFTNPADAAAIKVAFLNGVQAPFMETKQGWRTDGAEWKLRLDYRAQWFDAKGALTNAGV
jgi:hypothetical protein